MLCYIVRTQEACNRLMQELEKQGYLFPAGRKPTEAVFWYRYETYTCVYPNKSTRKISYANRWHFQDAAKENKIAIKFIELR